MSRFQHLLALFAFLTGAPALAQSGTHHMHVQLVAESAHPAPGKPLTLAVVMTPDPGWHGYWINPGEAGFAPTFDWRWPKGIEGNGGGISQTHASAFPQGLRYPVPEKLIVAGLVNHVFNGEHAILKDVQVQAIAQTGQSLNIGLKVKLLVCTAEICVPEEHEVYTVLTAGDGAPDAALASKFDLWRAAQPKPLDQFARYHVAGDIIELAIPYPASAPAPKDPWLFEVYHGRIEAGASQSFRRLGDLLLITAKAGAVALTAAPIPDTPHNMPAVLAFGDGRGLMIDAVPGPVPTGGTPITPQSNIPTPASLLTILTALGGALLGGLILNIMPCVFPIIGLKALALAKGGQAESQVRKEALAYTGGVIVTVLALGGAMLTLRAAGHAVGWAFQLQNPWVIGVLLVVVVGITANLLGLFELPSFGGGDGLTRKGGVQGSFWTGALAAFVATPCTGPFMAAALGAALVLPTYAALMIFAGLGLGMAAPFFALGFLPALRTRLPKPGAWMTTFRRIMAIPMALTALALVWLLWHEVAPQPKAQTAGIVNAQPFSEARLADLQGHHQPVFIYFTADWCLTCKVNERVAIQRQAVADSFKAHHIAVLEGDWTNGDPAITRFLEAHGRSGVPLYLFYPADDSAPKELPQVLSVGMLTGL